VRRRGERTRLRHARGRPIERRLRRELGALRAPDEPAAAHRARSAVLSAHTAVTPAPRPAWRKRAAVAVAALAVVVLVAAGLTAPGQAVGDWLRDVVQHRPEAPPPRPAPALPAPGRLLVARDAGVAVVASAGGAHRLGPYEDATWSPRGRFAAVTAGDALLAVTPGGAVRWRVTPPTPPRSPRWAPDGFRIAYLAGPQLRVMVADGTDDRLFFGHVRDVPPAFRPTAARTVAWVDRDRRVRVADVDRAVLEWRSPSRVPSGTRTLSWSADGNRLLAAARRRLVVFELRSNRAAPTTVRGRLAAAAFPPAGSGAPALVQRRAGRSSVRLLGRRAPLIATRGRYRGLTWSPDGRWLLTSWEDQWLLVRADGHRITSVPNRGRPVAWIR
jgi:hypothetical protein